MPRWYNTIIPSEARSLLGLEYLRMVSGRMISRASKFSFLGSLRRFRPRPRVLLRQKLWAPSRWSCKAYKFYRLAGLCLPGESMFAQPKTIAPSWPKIIRPVADGKDVVTRGLSIGLLLASFFHD